MAISWCSGSYSSENVNRPVCHCVSARCTLHLFLSFLICTPNAFRLKRSTMTTRIQWNRKPWGRICLWVKRPLNILISFHLVNRFPANGAVVRPPISTSTKLKLLRALITNFPMPTRLQNYVARSVEANCATGVICKFLMCQLLAFKFQNIATKNLQCLALHCEFKSPRHGWRILIGCRVQFSKHARAYLTWHSPNIQHCSPSVQGIFETWRKSIQVGQGSSDWTIGFVFDRHWNQLCDRSSETCEPSPCTETNGDSGKSTKQCSTACNSHHCGCWKCWHYGGGGGGSRPPKKWHRGYCFHSCSQTCHRQRCTHSCSQHPKSSRTAQGCDCSLNLLASCIFIICPALPNKVLAVVGQNIVFPHALIGPIDHIACPKEYLVCLFTRSRLGHNSWLCTVFTFKDSLRRPDDPHYTRGISNRTDMDVACTVGSIYIKDSMGIRLLNHTMHFVSL